MRISNKYLDKEVKFGLLDFLSVHFKFQRNLETKEQLVSFKDTRTSIVVDVVGQRIHDVL